MGLLSCDILHIDRVTDRSAGTAQIHDDTGRAIAQIVPAGPPGAPARRNWRVVEDGRVVLGVEDPRNAGRDRFRVLDPAGATAADITTTYWHRRQTVTLADGTRLSTAETTELGHGAAQILDAVMNGARQTVTWTTDGRTAATLATALSIHPVPHTLQLAPRLPARLRAVIIGSVIIRDLKNAKLDTRPDPSDFF